MRQVLRELAATGLLLAVAAPRAAAQQGSLQISGSAQSVHGDAIRVGTQPRLEPDVGVSWFQPSSRFGLFRTEVRASRRGDEPHLGKAFASWHDVRFGGAAWTLEAGDIYLTPPLGEYRFTNLTTPAVTFLGGAVSVRGGRSTASLAAGRTTAWRNMFGSDADTLGQSLALARASHRATDWLEVTARASRVRTTDLKEFTYTIAASDQAGGGARITIGPALQLVADGGVVAYRRAGSAERIWDGSGMAGASLSLARGWLQLNASRFSPGEFPLLNYPLVDRATRFAAGEYAAFDRLRVFGGLENFESNLDPLRSSASRTPQAEASGTRGFVGVHVLLGTRSSLALRWEDGDRRTRSTPNSSVLRSDTGVLSADLQSTFDRVTGFLRFSRRENVETPNAGGGYTQNDATAQLFVNLPRGVQLFGSAVATRNEMAVGGGSTYYQVGGGGQLQMLRRSLWLRAEALTTRNVDLLTANLVARESFNVGLNGQVARNTLVSLNVYADRAPPGAPDLNPWLTRSTLRVTRSFTTGTVRIAGPAGTAAVARARGTGSIAGSVFADWNGDGVPDPDEGPLEAIPVRLGTTGSATTSPRGEFSFLNVPVGLQRVELDTSALPVDFDPPAVTSVQVELTRGDTRRVAFGLVPLGAVTGRVLRDANANGTADADDEPIEGAVLVLDGGARSEQARKGRFRFDAVRSGDHVLELLIESLPEGAAAVGDRSVKISLTRDRLTASADFLVTIAKRPEIRRVFPPRGGGAAGATPAARPSAAPSSGRGTAPVKPAAPSTGAQAPQPGAFAIQIAALANETHAHRLVEELRAAGYPAYLVRPADNDPRALYRIRVGRYETRAALEKTLRRLEEKRGEKLWVLRER